MGRKTRLGKKTPKFREHHLSRQALGEVLKIMMVPLPKLEKTGEFIGIGEALRQKRSEEHYVDFSMLNPPKGKKKLAFGQIIKAVKMSAPKSKITIMPRSRKGLGKHFQDIRISNINAGEAVHISSALNLMAVIPK